MKPEDVRAEIQQLTLHLLERNLALDVGETILKRSPGCAWVSWKPRAGAPSLLEPDLFATVAEYRRLLRWRHYSCILSDGALLQFTYEFGNSESRRELDLTKHRLCYVPCPVDVEPADLQDGNGLDDVVEAALANCADRVRLRSSLRFDFDAGAGSHAAAHLTLVVQDCRWPVFGPLSVGHFVRFVFRTFYPAVWSGQEELRAWTIGRSSRCIGEADEGELFVECRPNEGRRLLERIGRRLARRRS